MIEFLHPSVTTRITDNSMTYVTAQGLTQMFIAFTSDKGVDNKIKRISSPSEWIFNYGEPNISKHGQAAYNALNWLTNGGGIYALRVTSDDAKYSHAFLNIQTKKGVKKVKNYRGEIKIIPNVDLRVTTSYTETNNSSINSIYDELYKSNRVKTIDGYDNNFLLAVTPKGRGKAYNNLGFRMTLTTVMDTTYNFRLYNFEVTETRKDGSTEVIEGPFMVSFDPEAISISNESLFIEDVIKRYSKYIDVKFNEETYDTLGEIINPEVNPAVLDFISGKTRNLDNGPETYFNEETEEDEDVHLALHRYNELGERVKDQNNIHTSESKGLAADILDIDYGLRLNQSITASKNVDNKLLALSRYRKSGDAFKSELSKLAELDNEHKLVGGTLKTAIESIEKTKKVFDEKAEKLSDKSTNEELSSISETGNVLNSAYKRYVAIMKNVLDYTTIINVSENSLAAGVELASIERRIAQYTVTSIQLTTFLDRNIDALDALNDLKVSTRPNLDHKLNESKVLLGELLDTLNTIISISQGDDFKQAKVQIEKVKEKIIDASRLHDLASDTYSLQSEIEEYLNELIELMEDSYGDLSLAIRLIRTESHIKLIASLHPISESVTSIGLITISDVIEAIDNADTPELKVTIEEQMKANVDRAIADKNDTKSNAFKTILLPSSRRNVLREGSDGVLDEKTQATERKNALDNLLIRAYKGFIDESILNKKETPIDIILDANYSPQVKIAIHQLASDIRKDCIAMLDTGFTHTPEESITFKDSFLNLNSRYSSIFTQDFIIYDEFSGRDIKVTTPYFLASKIPSLDNGPGFSYPMAGPRRGAISGYKKLSYNPTPVWKEELYKNKINYIERDPSRTNLATELTSQSMVSALSYIHNMRTLLRIVRDVESLGELYRMEFNDEQTISSFQEALNITLDKWRNNRACKNVTANVYASNYDRDQGIIRVRIQISFTSITERVIIEVNVEK